MPWLWSCRAAAVMAAPAGRIPMDVSRRKFIVAGTAVAAAGVAATPARADAARLDAGTDDQGSGGQGAPRGMWFAGDTHVHDDHSSDGSLPRQRSRQTLPGNLPVG